MKKALLIASFFVLSLPSISFARDTVVIVPGVAGSYLDGVVGAQFKNIWPGLEILLPTNTDSHLDELRMDIFGNSQNVSVSASDVIEEFIATSYGDLVNNFRNQGYVEGQDLFVLPYDWRLSIASTSADIGAVLFREGRAAQERQNGDKIVIVAHSMGGLLVKNYLLTPNTGFNPDWLRKVIFVGMPQVGSPKTFKLLNYGDNLGISVFNTQKAKEISQNMPSIYQLLPSQAYFERVGPYVRDFRGLFGVVGGFDMSFEVTQTFMTENPLDARNPFLLSQADAFHTLLDGRSGLEGGPNAEKVYNLIACSRPTISKIHIEDDGEFDIEYGKGDGTVPFGSANYNTQAQNVIYFNGRGVLPGQETINHLGLVKNDNVLDLIFNLIQGDDVSLPPGASTDRQFCFPPLGIDLPGWVSFYTQSPVDLHVYDEAGNHVGKNANGDPELGIPESDFFELGDNNFVLVPGGQKYRVVVDAYGTGEFNLKVKTFAGETPVASLSFNDVAIPNANLLAEFIFDDIASRSDLVIDENGDGHDDYLIDTQGHRIDITPVDTTAPEFRVAFSPSTKDVVFTSEGSVSCTNTRCTTEDMAGNDTTLTFAKKKILNVHTLSLKSVQYNTISETLAPNALIVRYTLKNGAVEDVYQTFLVKNQEIVRIEYSKRKNVSTLWQYKNGTLTKEMALGLKLLTVTTAEGELVASISE